MLEPDAVLLALWEAGYNWSLTMFSTCQSQSKADNTTVSPVILKNTYIYILLYIYYNIVYIYIHIYIYICNICKPYPHVWWNPCGFSFVFSWWDSKTSASSCRFRPLQKKTQLIEVAVLWQTSLWEREFVICIYLFVMWCFCMCVYFELTYRSV